MDSRSDLRISIGVRAYNSARFIESAIRSCVEQEERPNELIIVDDGSTDGTTQIVDMLCREIAAYLPVRFIRHGRNEGVGAALQTLIDHCTGDWLLIADGDDIQLPSRVGATRRAIAGSSEECVCVLTASRNIDANGRELGTSGQRGRASALTVCAVAAGAGCPASLACFRRDFLLRGTSLRGLRQQEDRALALRVALFGQAVETGTVEVLKRVHAANTSGPGARLLSGRQSRAWFVNDCGRRIAAVQYMLRVLRCEAAGLVAAPDCRAAMRTLIRERRRLVAIRALARGRVDALTLRAAAILVGSASPKQNLKLALQLWFPDVWNAWLRRREIGEVGARDAMAHLDRLS